MTVEVYAPGVVKLLGEHAVVYGKKGVAVALNMRARATVESSESSQLEIRLPDLEIVAAVGMHGLKSLYEARGSGSLNPTDFLKNNPRLSKKELAAYAYYMIAARLANEFGIDVAKNVEITSTIPVGLGYASSAACCTAFTVALVRASGVALSDEQIIDIARDGERFIHGNPNAGSIDVSTSYLGGIVSWSKKTGPIRENIDENLELVLIDTGPKKSTLETVAIVSDFVNRKNPERGAEILDDIDKLSNNGVFCLKLGDFRSLGALMFKDQELLAELGVSSPEIDRAVEVGKRSGALGVKLSGGGGGGLVVAIAEPPSSLIDAMETNGFPSRIAKVSFAGARDYLRTKSRAVH